MSATVKLLLKTHLCLLEFHRAGPCPPGAEHRRCSCRRCYTLPYVESRAGIFHTASMVAPVRHPSAPLSSVPLVGRRYPLLATQDKSDSHIHSTTPRTATATTTRPPLLHTVVEAREKKVTLTSCSVASNTVTSDGFPATPVRRTQCSRDVPDRLAKSTRGDDAVRALRQANAEWRSTCLGFPPRHSRK